MMLVALLLRSGSLLCKVLRVIPKAMADDVLIIGKGSGMLGKYAHDPNETHKYLQAMGAGIAPAKVYSFASCESARKWLEETWWGTINTTIEVVKDFRYLGVHLSTALLQKQITLIQR